MKNYFIVYYLNSNIEIHKCIADQTGVGIVIAFKL